MSFRSKISVSISVAPQCFIYDMRNGISLSFYTGSKHKLARSWGEEFSTSVTADCFVICNQTINKMNWCRMWKWWKNGKHWKWVTGMGNDTSCLWHCIEFVWTGNIAGWFNSEFGWYIETVKTRLTLGWQYRKSQKWNLSLILQICQFSVYNRFNDD